MTENTEKASQVVEWFSELYHALYGYEGEHPYQDILLPWMGKAMQNMAVLQKYGNLEAMKWREKDIEVDLWNLYALSRISDLLLLAFQESHGEYDYDVEIMKRVTGLPLRRPKIQLDEYHMFWIELGMESIQVRDYDPFFHEIVEVEQAEDPDEPITLVSSFWPGFMLDHLLFSRAGVKVRGGSNFVKKDIAEHSTLYFTFVRRNRPVDDLSHGWGHNSQWRTSFRRDYQDQGTSTFHYNVGEQHMGEQYDLTQADRVMSEWEQGLQVQLERPERIELLVNRCFIRTEKPYEDRYPFHDTYRESCLKS